MKMEGQVDERKKLRKVSPRKIFSERTPQRPGEGGIYLYYLEAVSISDPGKQFTQVKKMLLCR